MYIRRHGVSKPSGTESFTSSVHTNGTKTKPTNPPTHQPANEYSIFSSGKHLGRAYKNIYNTNSLLTAASRVIADPSFWRPACRRLLRGSPEPAATQRHERVLRGLLISLSSPTPLPWARVAKHSLDVLLPSLYLMRISSTPVQCHAFLFFIKSSRLFHSYLARETQIYNPKFPFFSIPYHTYQIVHTAYQIS